MKNGASFLSQSGSVVDVAKPMNYRRLNENLPLQAPQRIPYFPIA